VTITDIQIRDLRNEALAAGDIAQVVICDLALGDLDEDRAEYDEPVGNMRVVTDYYNFNPHALAHLRSLGIDDWDRDRAKLECERALVTP
jgi:hypothetical protein